MKESISEADALNILKAITPRLGRAKHKGQAGNIAVIGGCGDSASAPYFAAISALKTGADLIHVFCTHDAAPLIKTYSPELIVHPILPEYVDQYKAADAVKEFAKWIERFDCLVVGPDLGPGYYLKEYVGPIIKQARQLNLPIVVDGDGLDIVTNNLDFVRGYPLAVLTPNLDEYKQLVQKVLDCPVHDRAPESHLDTLAENLGGVTILLKGRSDHISDGSTVESVSIDGSPRRCRGQGDILSGSVAVFLVWAKRYISTSEEDEEEDELITRSPTVLACIAGSALVRKAAALAFDNMKRSTLAGDIIECLGKSMEDISPATH